MKNILNKIPALARNAILIARIEEDENGTPRAVIAWANLALAELFGYDLEEILGKPPSYFDGPDTDYEQLERIRQRSVAGEPVREEILYYKKDGTPLWVEGNITHIDAPEMDAPHFVSILHDITERRTQQEDLLRAKEAAETANRAKSSFLAMMSHELRTPLNSILGFAQIMQMEQSKLPEGSEHAEYLENIRSSGTLLLRVIGDLLDIAKLDSEKFNFEEEEFCLADEMQNFHAAWKNKAQEKGLKLDLSLDLSQTRFLGDKARLFQVLNNIVFNAIKYTKAGGVKVQVGEGASAEGVLHLVVDVIDTGVGIANNNLKKIFEPFERVGSDQSLSEEGVGLGLAISQRIIQGMNGTLSVESELEYGSTFSLSIPMKLANPAASDKPVPVHLPDRHLTGPAKILVAEDNPMNQRVIQSILTALGHEFEIVGDGKQAVRAATMGDFAIILMDISMPVMSGDMAMRVIRAMDSSIQTLPIIAVTAHAMKGDKERFLTAGFTDYLPKPIDVASLSGILAKHLGDAQAVA